MRTCTTVLALTMLGGCAQLNPNDGGPTPAPTSTPSKVFARLRQVDRNAIVALVKSGGNRACAHDIENEIVVQNLADGEAIAHTLSPDTYFVRVAQKANGHGALVIIEQHTVPSDQNILDMVARMKRIAAAHNGLYRQWETDPVKVC